MPEDDTIGRIIQRDLDQLPLLPADRWIPRNPSTDSRGALSRATSALALTRAVSVGLAVVVVGAAAGLSLANWRAQRTTPDASPAAAVGVPGPLALAGGAPSLGFGLVSTEVNTLLIRNEITPSAPFTVPNALPQVAVSPAGHDIAYWRALPDQAGHVVYELDRSDLLDPGVRDRVVMRAPTGEAPGALIWSSDGMGLIANTRTPTPRGGQTAPASGPPHASWFKIDVASTKIEQLPQTFADAFSVVYAWDRSRDLVTGSAISFGSPLVAGGPTFLTFKVGLIESHLVPIGGVIAAADLYARSVVVAYAGGCKGPPQDSTLRCPVLEVRDQATFAIVTGSSSVDATTDYPDVVFRPRSEDLIVQLSLKNGDARAELWSDLGRGAHQVLATYSQTLRGTIRFTSRRELVLPRVDGSAVFLLKFDDSAGGRWFGEVVGLFPLRGATGFERTPFEILTGGNPLASVVLDPAFARALDARLSASPKPTPFSSARDAIVQRFSRTSAEIRRVDRIDAKLMTRAEFERAAKTGSSSPNADPNQLVWVVAIGGDVVPAFSRGQAFAWGIYLVSADTGEVASMLAGSDSWPPYFDVLPDRASDGTSPGTLPICPPGQSPLLDVAQNPPPGDQPGTGAAAPEAAFRKAFPTITDYKMYEFGTTTTYVERSAAPGQTSGGPVWIIADRRTFISLYIGAPGQDSWFAHPATFLGCRTPQELHPSAPPGSPSPHAP